MTTPCPPASCARLGEARRGTGRRIAFEALAWGRHVDDYRRAWRSSNSPPTTLSASAWTASTSCPAVTIRPRSRRIPAARCSSCSSRTLRAEDGRAVLARHHRLFPGREASIWGASSTTWCGRVRRTVVARGVQRRLPADRGRQHRAPCAPVAARGWRTGSAAGPCRRSPSRRARLRRAAWRSTPTRSMTSWQQLGFTFRGVHRSKEVRLWADGRRASSATSSTPGTARPCGRVGLPGR